MTLQVSDGKGRNFLNLVGNDYEDIEPSYIKDGPWLQTFGHSNLLCTHATRAITNYALIGEYYLRFFPNEDFKCPCRNYPTESRRHILHDCMRFNRYWNPRRDSLYHFVMFLIANPKAFMFIDNLHSVTSNWFWNDLYYSFYFSLWILSISSFSSFPIFLFSFFFHLFM